jgi:hypothetical protein
VAAKRDRARDKERSTEERVDAWGESQKAARKNLPKKRARSHRAYRHAVKTELAKTEDAEPEAIRRKPFKKWVGPTRGTHLERQEDRREKLQVEPRRSEAARARRGLRRAGRARPE